MDFDDKTFGPFSGLLWGNARIAVPVTGTVSSGIST
jgi:hypothetical protein